MPFLSSADVSDRQKAMGALLAFGTNALVARKLIQSALTDSDPWVRMQAGRALKKLDSMEGTKVGEYQSGPANRAPSRSETNQTSSAAGSRR